MLILTRRVGETVMIGNDVTVTVLGVKGNQVRIGVNAPRMLRFIVKRSTSASSARKIGRQIRAHRSPRSSTTPELAPRPSLALPRLLGAGIIPRSAMAVGLIRRGGRVVEGAPLLRAYGSKAHRGFESLPLRQVKPQRMVGLPL